GRDRLAVPAGVRARRAGLPGDAVAGLHGPYAGRVPGGRRSHIRALDPGVRRSGARGYGRGRRAGDAMNGVPLERVTIEDMNPPPSLEVRAVHFAYPDGHVALHGVDLTVHRGERVALLGPNGAGKTTLVLHLNGILPPPQAPGAAGSVIVSGLTANF